MVHDHKSLRQFQSMDLKSKVFMTEERIRSWYESWTRYGIYTIATERTRHITAKEQPYVDEDKEWVDTAERGAVYVSFSGGKDSTVLLHIARRLYPDIPAVFVDTGLEYPEIREFVKVHENVTILRPKMRFDEVIRRYGYPIISKEVAKSIATARRGIQDHKYNLALCQIGVRPDEFGGLERDARYDYEKTTENSIYTKEKYRPLLTVDFKIGSYCCDIMKKGPAHEYSRETGRMPITAQLADESLTRRQAWFKHGCNAFDAKHPVSSPMSFWTEQDVLQYIRQNNLPIAKVYGAVEYETDPEQMRFIDIGIDVGVRETLHTTGCDRTGCIFCGFGCHIEKRESRFERLHRTHPRQYEYCMCGGEYNADGLWQPNSKGLGLKHVFDTLNGIYGAGFIRY